MRIWPLVVENISEERRRKLKFGYFWSMRGRELLVFSRTEGESEDRLAGCRAEGACRTVSGHGRICTGALGTLKVPCAAWCFDFNTFVAFIYVLSKN